jgi:hypothetical protein
MKNISLLLVMILIMTTIKAQSGLGTGGGASEMSSFKSANMTLNIDPFGVVDRDGTMLGMRYADISGSPFLYEDWRMANIFDINNKKIAQVKVKYNTNTDQIHFLDDKEKELVADKAIISKVEMLTNLEHNETAVSFEKGFTDTKNTLTSYQFVQVLNEGSIQLLKHFSNQILQKDSLFGTMKINKFSPNASYYLKTGNNTISLRKLDLEELSILLPNKELVLNFTKSKKKIKSEKDFVDLLNFYNKRL